MIIKRVLFITAIVFLSTSILVLPLEGEEVVNSKHQRKVLHKIWRSRIQSFLDIGVIPLLDLESSLKPEDGDKYIDDAIKVMDELGVALIAFDGYQAPKKKKKEKGYRWGYYIHKIVNAHPDHFILATNGGTNNNWLRQKDSFVDQTVEHVKSGGYPIMGEFDFRHYLSNSQCKKGQTERDSDIPINSPNGHRIFALSQETEVAFAIHLEAEDRPLDEFEEMLGAYPRAKVIWAHFGQIRHPRKENRYTPELLRRLLAAYPNLYIDLATGEPGRLYKCNNNILDTVIWQDSILGEQKNTLKPVYKDILSEFSNRFVFGSDYGGGRRPLHQHLKKKTSNARLIIRDLSEDAKHQISYQNAWLLLTGRPWRPSGRVRPYLPL